MKKAFQSFKLINSRSFSSAKRTLTQETISKQPQKPHVKTATVPGPLGLKLIESQNECNQCARSISFHMDVKKSIGNYICDSEGNVLLDIFNHIAAVPIGYNHQALVNAIQDGVFNQALTFRSAQATHPPADTPQLLKKTYLAIAPPGLTEVIPTCGCGSSANMNAIKMAHLWHRRNLLGRDNFTQEELQKAQMNQVGGCSDFKVLSFMKGFHGRVGQTLAATHTNPLFKAGFPSHDYPCAEFPQYKFPLHANKEHNKKEDQRCIDIIDKILKKDRTQKSQISALIIEPLPSEGGNLELSKEFFQQVRILCTQYKVAMIVDEVQSGVGASGKWWFCQHFMTDQRPQFQPDMMTIAKKAQTSAVLMKKEFRPPHAFQIFGTWSGDYLRLKQFDIIVDTIKSDGLLQQTDQVGAYFKKGLQDLAQRGKQIQNVRGRAALLAFDMSNDTEKEPFLKAIKKNGLNMAPSARDCVRIRSSLILQNKHVDIALDIIEKTLKQVKKAPKM